MRFDFLCCSRIVPNQAGCRAIRGFGRRPAVALASSRQLARSAGRPAGAAAHEQARHRHAFELEDVAAAAALRGSSASILLNTSTCGTSAAPISAARAAPRRSARDGSGWRHRPRAAAGRHRRLLQRGLEGVDQAVRQVADEPDGVGQGYRAAPRYRAAFGRAQVELAGRGVEAWRTAGLAVYARALTRALNSVDLPALV
jgi:hypothetical protein